MEKNEHIKKGITKIHPSTGYFVEGSLEIHENLGGGEFAKTSISN